jgi:hypothetical protein
MRQTGAQSFIGPEEQRFYGRFRASQHPGYLRVLHFFVLMHQHSRPLLLRQASHGPADFFEFDSKDQLLLD